MPRPWALGARGVVPPMNGALLPDSLSFIEHAAMAEARTLFDGQLLANNVGWNPTVWRLGTPCKMGGTR